MNMNITVKIDLDIDLDIDIDELMDNTLRDIIKNEIESCYMEDILDCIEVSE
jgi:sporulation-control protein spo0M